ncbi:MAG: hypothetical protein PHN31_05190 [Candidatus Gracilibacteria bacterium]|nr:hypothetical protein [Candidatus Gracilibacteria bacterium]
MGLSSKRPRRLNYAVNKIAAKSGNKVSNSIKSYKKLLERVEFEGKTKWLENALKFTEAKLKKYGINKQKI